MVVAQAPTFPSVLRSPASWSSSDTRSCSGEGSWSPIIRGGVGDGNALEALQLLG